MESDELRHRAEQEVQELGPEPVGRRERVLWSEERRGALVLLAALADYDPALLRRATLEDADELDDHVRALLVDAARYECGNAKR